MARTARVVADAIMVPPSALAHRDMARMGMAHRVRAAMIITAIMAAVMTMVAATVSRLILVMVALAMACLMAAGVAVLVRAVVVQGGVVRAAIILTTMDVVNMGGAGMVAAVVARWTGRRCN